MGRKHERRVHRSGFGEPREECGILFMGGRGKNCRNGNGIPNGKLGSGYMFIPESQSVQSAEDEYSILLSRKS